MDYCKKMSQAASEKMLGFRLRASHIRGARGGNGVRPAFITPNLCQSLPFGLTGGISYFAVQRGRRGNEPVPISRERRRLSPLSPALFYGHLSYPRKTSYFIV